MSAYENRDSAISGRRRYRYKADTCSARMIDNNPDVSASEKLLVRGITSVDSNFWIKSMFSISAPAADTIYTCANVLLVVGATLALIGTAGVFWSGGVRERFADERISTNEAETAKAKAETAKALLEQERLKSLMAWRRVSPAQAQRLSSVLKGRQIEVWLAWVGNDPEATVLRGDLDAALTAAEVKTKYYSGYARAVGLTVTGGTAEERRLLLQAFHAAGLPLVESDQQGMMNGQLEITVGTKPPPEFHE